MKSVLILGGFGYIGINLANKLYKMDYDIYVVDNINNPAVLEQSKDIKFKFFNVDVRNYKDLHTIMNNIKIDIVIWCVDILIQHIQDYYDVNINGLINIINLMNTFTIDKFIYLSSNDIYGTGKNLTELDNCAPVTIEGKTKLLAEDIIKNVYRHNFYILRIGNVIGKTEVTQFMGNRINVLNNLFMYNFFNNIIIPHVVHDYVHIHDLLDSICICISLLSSSVIQRYIVNIGTGNQLTEKRLFEKYLKKYKISNINHEFIKHDRIYSTISSDFATSLLNWKAKYDIV